MEAPWKYKRYRIVKGWILNIVANPLPFRYNGGKEDTTMIKRFSAFFMALAALLLSLSLAGCSSADLNSVIVTTPDAASSADSQSPENDLLPEDGSYTTKDDVALYLHQYGHLPDNFMSKKDAEALGWEGGSLEPYAPGMCIGGSRFGNYEGLLPEASGRTYKECDIDTLGVKSRGAKRIVFSNDGLIYYTADHYETFELLYGEE